MIVRTLIGAALLVIWGLLWYSRGGMTLWCDSIKHYQTRAKELERLLWEDDDYAVSRRKLRNRVDSGGDLAAGLARVYIAVGDPNRITKE
nr:hypothetical protein [uncultured Oscillibacter sp.]